MTSQITWRVFTISFALLLIHFNRRLVGTAEIRFVTSHHLLSGIRVGSISFLSFAASFIHVFMNVDVGFIVEFNEQSSLF